MKISDEIRNFCNICFTKDGFNRDDLDKLLELANRIDHEMVALPRNKDGKVFHVGGHSERG